MENASKALIIAGAILISIVLITLGVVILGQGQDIVNNSNMDSEEIAMFNKKFTQYTGDKVSGSKVNSLVDAVISNNVVALREGSYNKLIEIQITGSLASDSNDIKLSNKTDVRDTNYTEKFITRAKSGTLYGVKIGGYNTSGYINLITINSTKQGT